MITVSILKKEMKGNESEFQRQLKELDREYRQDKKAIIEHRKETEKEYKGKIEECEEMGELIGKHEAQNFLGVSRQRMELLMKRNQFRVKGQYLSYADVKKYKKGRKVGRPVNSTNRKEKE